jgi:CubicO group peptidase (beta-lactamase class C family)
MKAIIFFGYFFLLSSCSGQPSGRSISQELRNKITDNAYPKIDATLVEKNNSIIVEEYFNGFTKESPHDLRSSFKSITSLLAGIAIDQQLFKLTDSIGRFFPELKDERKRSIRVQDLLEMRSGLNCEEFYEIGPECETDMMNSKDWVAFCLGADMIREPGLNWSYNSNEPLLVGEIITRASGMSVMDFAKKYLFQPLGVVQYKWTVSPTGSGMTAGSFYMKPIDFIKIINLVKQKGKPSILISLLPATQKSRTRDMIRHDMASSGTGRICSMVI